MLKEFEVFTNYDLVRVGGVKCLQAPVLLAEIIGLSIFELKLEVGVRGKKLEIGGEEDVQFLSVK